MEGFEIKSFVFIENVSQTFYKLNLYNGKYANTVSQYIQFVCFNVYFLRGISRRLLAAVPWCQSNQCAHHTSGTSLKYIPRRAVLYVPGNDERKLRKLTSLDVDCAVLDCEDGVALNMKVPTAPILYPTPDVTSKSSSFKALFWPGADP